MKIGFFGDSFCAVDVAKPGQHETEYETYITKLRKHYTAEIVNLGVSGSSIYDLMLLQVTPFIDTKNYPDVCIFVWTDYGRLFNRKHRGLNTFSIGSLDENNFVAKAAKQYYSYLFDWELSQFQYVAALQYFDLNVLSNFPKSTKIIHIWGFEKLHNWKHGIEVPNILIKLAKEGREINEIADWAPNHIDGNDKNNILFEQIKTEIDNYYEQRTI